MKHLCMRTIFNRAVWARNTSLTYGGKTPLEIAFGRRPPDVMDLENMTVEQLQVECGTDQRRVTLLDDLAKRHTLKPGSVWIFDEISLHVYSLLVDLTILEMVSGTGTGTLPRFGEASGSRARLSAMTSRL